MKKVQNINATTLQIAVNAKKIRDLLGMTQDDFSKAIDMKLSVLKKWDTGKYVAKN